MDLPLPHRYRFPQRREEKPGALHTLLPQGLRESRCSGYSCLFRPLSFVWYLSSECVFVFRLQLVLTPQGSLSCLNTLRTTWRRGESPGPNSEISMTNLMIDMTQEMSHMAAAGPERGNFQWQRLSFMDGDVLDCLYYMFTVSWSIICIVR